MKLTGRIVRLVLSLYIRLISDSLFDVSLSDLSVLPVNILCQKTSELSECSANLVTETFAEPPENWLVLSNRILTGTISRPSCSFICVELVIHYLCGIRVVSDLSFLPSKCDITRPPNFRKFLQTTEECCNRNICRTC